MNIKNAQYVATAVRPDQYPAHRLPEVALVGRSNAGKSSLINALANRKNLARVAAEPGKTRTVNFYDFDNALYLADLPGYGFARVSKTEKASWSEMIETYLLTREQLRLIVMLIDIRHAPSADDQTMHEWLIHQGRPSLLVASKADKIPRGQIPARLREIRAVLELDEDEPLLPFSAVTKAGREEVWNQIQEILGK
jgi:GTP-binding protein